MSCLSLFATKVWQARLAPAAGLNEEIAAAARTFAEEDAAGRKWCRDNGYPGYTSHGSLNDLPRRAPCFARLKALLDAQAAEFCRVLAFDLGGGKAELDNLWVNILERGGFHSGHIHPHSVISGVYYVATPRGSSPLKLEDPRLPLMMNAPPRRDDAADDLKSFVYLTPEPGLLVMWESWLRHEAPRHLGRSARISVSFNYRWA